MGDKAVTENRKARHNYHILDTFEAGIVLRGTEVKSLREGAMTLKDSYASVEHGNMYLVGAHIAPYDKGNINNHDPERKRRLLMHKREIIKLNQQLQEKGLTLVPLKVYFKGGRAKLLLGLGKGKQQQDKRQAIQEREVKRETDRYLKEANR